MRHFVFLLFIIFPLQSLLAQDSELLDFHFKNSISATEILITGDAETYKKWLDEEKNVEKNWKNFDASSPYFLFAQAEYQLQKALLKAYFNEIWGAVWAIKNAFVLLENNEKLFPNFLPNYKSLGVLRVVLGSVPEKNQWILQFFGLKGSNEQGLENLRKLAQSDNMFASEARLYECLLQAYLLGQPEKAYENSQNLLKEMPNNDLVRLATAAIALKNQQSAVAYRCLADTDENANLALISYFKGESALLSGNYEKSIVHFKHFQSHYKGRHFVKAGYYKHYLAVLMHHEQHDAVLLAKIKTQGFAESEADRYALHFAATNTLPDKRLLKARLMIDGGNFDLAQELLKALSAQDFKQKNDTVEWYYRKARAFHGQKRFAEALHYYDKTIAEQGNLNIYLAPHAALQAGYLTEKYLNNKTKARKYYQKALSYQEYDYQNSIERQAKNALKSK